MDEYKQYLAQKLLTEDQLVTYRLLSRALKVHVNTAKEMLYDFHKWQNDKRPNSLHATYMIYGTKKQIDEQDGDVEMTNSQDSDGLHVPLSDEVPILTLSLVKEEQLQEVLAQYDEVTSIHVYSLAPHPLKDLQLLADTARQVLELSSGDNPPASEKVFGAITNPNMRKRERRGPPPRSITNVPAPKVEPKAEAKPTTTVPVKEEPKAPSAKAPTTSAPIKKPTPAASGKRANSGIGQMFAKAAAKPKKPAAPKPAEVEKSAALSDDGEDDDTEPMAGVKQEDQEDSSARQSRKDRQAELERMMDEDDDEEDEEEKADSPAEEPMEEDEPEPEPEPTKTEEKEEEEVVSTTAGGRRRGRRRVTRKKQILDEQGYLVTIQEPGWESFSEDEAPAPPPKPKAGAKAEPAAAAGTTKPKKGAAAGGKGSQGNIMSFFSKK
ncbi:DNA polymerase subunit Cdc27 [Biscogniauxia mediterranea]|nr:DNA polymerase subunit Cdc27 [Biscogniauxia mediterranea]